MEKWSDQTSMAKKQGTGVLWEQLNAQRKPFLVPVLSVLSGFFTPCFVVSPPSSPDFCNVSGKPFLCKISNGETAENPLVSLKWELSASVLLFGASFHTAGVPPAKPLLEALRWF